jgi:hypothetical protein
MNTCPNCQSDVEDDHDLCWNCQYSFSEDRIVPDTEFPQVCQHCKTEADASFAFCPNCHQPLGLNRTASDTSGLSGTREIDCLRCKVPMFFKGNSNFRERTRVGIPGNLVEFLSNRESFDLYFCPQCGKIEFFLPPELKPE